MAKTFTIFLTTNPSSFENILSVARIAESALRKGHHVRLVASGDEVYFLLREKGLKPLFQGLKVLLSEKGMKDRHTARNDYMDTAEIISLEEFFNILKDTDIWINL